MSVKLCLLLVVTVALIALCGCTAYRITPIPHDDKLEKVYVLHNERVRIQGFEDLLIQRFNDIGIETEVVGDTRMIPSDSYWVSYTGRRSWKIMLFLVHAEVNVYKGHTLVGKGCYHHRGKFWSFALTKWKSTAGKMNPLYDKLLENCFIMKSPELK